VDAYSRMELCTSAWLNYDYGDGGVMDILTVDAYSRVEVCTPIFLGEARKCFFGRNSFLNFFFKTQMDIPPNKSSMQTRVVMGIIF
jgi:hypothetical protein